MINSLDFNSIIRADCVKRWQVVAVSRQQSVAEHSFNVITISREILKEFLVRANVQLSAMVTSYWVAGIMEAAYLHDLAEVETGDIHTNAKRLLKIGDLVSETESRLLKGHAMSPVDSSEFPVDDIVKIADLMDAYRYLWLWGVGTRAAEIKQEITNTLVGRINMFNPGPVKDATQEVLRKVYKECHA